MKSVDPPPPPPFPLVEVVCDPEEPTKLVNTHEWGMTLSDKRLTANGINGINEKKCHEEVFILFLNRILGTSFHRGAS